MSWNITSKEELFEGIFEDLVDNDLIDLRNYDSDPTIACGQAKGDVMDIIRKAFDGYLIIKGEVM